MHSSDTDLTRYHLTFFGYYAVTLAITVVIGMLMNGKGSGLAIGMIMVWLCAQQTLRKFWVENGRGFSNDERWRMFRLALAVLMAKELAIGLYMRSVINSDPFAVLLGRTMPLGVIIGGLVLVGLLYTLMLYWIYYRTNRKLNEGKVVNGINNVRGKAGRTTAAASGASLPVAGVAKKLTVLVLGDGGREHALAWKLAQSARVGKVIVAPGNAGTSREAKCVNADVDLSDLDALLALARREGVDLTVVGPEGPLAAGVVDRFRANGQRIFGPTAAAAQLGANSAFAKDFLARHGIPDAESLTGETAGEEATYVAMVDGRNILSMATSQDYKRLADNDAGPSTGGMGACSPAAVVTPQVEQRILREIIEPTVRGMAKEGAAFTGFLYASILVDASGAPRLVEFNVRLGDPEAQPMMMRLQSDLLALVEAAVDQRLEQMAVRWNPRPCVAVVMAADNYPGTPRTGDAIEGLDVRHSLEVKVFHSATRDLDGRVVTAGGRVLTVCALGDTVTQAQRTAYEAVDSLAWAGEHHRRDIGWRAAAREPRPLLA